MRFLLIYTPYGSTEAAVYEASQKEVDDKVGHIWTNRKLPFMGAFLSVKEWMEGAAVGEYCYVPSEFVRWLVRIS